MPAFVDTYGPSVAALLATAVAWLCIRWARRRRRPERRGRRDASGARGSMAGSVVRWLVVAVALAADFSGATFRGVTTFRGASFTAERTSFWGVAGTQATLDFSAAAFTGHLVDFSRSDLASATLWFEGAESDDCLFRDGDDEFPTVADFAAAVRRGDDDAGSPKAPGVDPR